MADRYEFNMKGNSLWSILILVMMFIGVFVVARLIFRLLYFLAPALLIAVLIIDRRVITEYFRWIGRAWKRDKILGIGAGVLTVIGFPVVVAFLLGKAILRKQVRKAETEYIRQRDGDLVDFEELDSKPLNFDQLDKQVKERPSYREEDLI